MKFSKLLLMFSLILSTQVKAEEVSADVMYEALAKAIETQSAEYISRAKDSGFDLSIAKERQKAARFVVTNMQSLIDKKCPDARDFNAVRAMSDLAYKIYFADRSDKKEATLDTNMIYGTLSKRIQTDINDMNGKRALCDINKGMDPFKN